VIVAGQTLGWLLASWVGPAPPQLSEGAHGDGTLLAAVSRALDGQTLGFDAMAVAEIDDEGTRFATFGRQFDGAPVDPSSRFEIGSLTKALTGLLLADLIDAGRVEADTTLAEATDGVLPLEGEGAKATLSRLARHRAGWPSLPGSMLPRAMLLSTGGRNPYAGDPERVLEIGAGQDASRGDQLYSNLGFAALGNALAASERTDYASLLERRVLDPLDMRDTRVLGADDPLPERRLSGHDSAGRSTKPGAHVVENPGGGRPSAPTPPHRDIHTDLVERIDRRTDTLNRANDEPCHLESVVEVQHLRHLERRILHAAFADPLVQHGRGRVQVVKTEPGKPATMVSPRKSDAAASIGVRAPRRGSA